MFCGEIARRSSRSTLSWGWDRGPGNDETSAGGRGAGEEEFAGKTSSRQRRRRRRRRWLAVRGLGGFCLRHCAISSQWLNRSFASSPFSPPFFCRFFLFFACFLRAPSPSSRFTVSRLTRYSLYPSVVPGGDAVLGLSPVTYAQELSFRSVTLSRFISMPRYFCIFLSAVLNNGSSAFVRFFF